MRADVRERIELELREHPVVIYMKGTEMFPRCGFSAAAADTLRRAGAAGRIHSVDVLADPELWEAVKEFSDWPTIPQVYVGGEFLGGSDTTRELHESGELEPKIQNALAAADRSSGSGSS